MIIIFLLLHMNDFISSPIKFNDNISIYLLSEVS